MANKTLLNQFEPDCVTPPGETLRETIEAMGMEQAELADRVGRPRKTINEIVKGKAAITPDTALQLEYALGVPASFWNNRERRYQEFLARKAERERLNKQVEWLERFPIRAMVKAGWIEPFKDKVHQLQEVLNFFGIASPDRWPDLWPQVDFRHSKTFKSQPEALSAWLRKGELEAQKLQCGPYDKKKFREALREIHIFTVKPIQGIYPRMIELCARAGVALVLVPELPHVRVGGATRWLNPDKALIQLTLRYKTNDHFWFSFFHEAAHILLQHSKQKIFIQEEEASLTDVIEKEANRFAANFLIPPGKFQEFVDSYEYRSLSNIRAFADSLGIASGIVVGRLQHEKRIPWKNGNDLKEKFVYKQNHGASDR